jgi:hypothetical protein
MRIFAKRLPAMSRISLFLLCSVIGTSFSAPARASFDTGNTLYSACSTERGDTLYYQNNSICMGYVSGVFDVLTLQDFANRKQACPLVTGMTRTQLVDIVLKYIRDNPGERNLSAAVMVIGGLKDAFPSCGFGIMLQSND